MADTKTDPSGAGAKATEVSLLDDILAETKLKPSDDVYDVAKRGVTAFITELLAPGKAIERVDKSLVDAMIAELDARMSAQVNEILHKPEFQKLESAWRGLRFMIERVDFRENIRVQLLNVSKEELLEKLGLTPYFAAITCGDTFEFRKPDARHILGTIEKAGGDPARTIMVGDSINDILAAKNANVPSIGVTFGYTDVPMAELKPDVVIDNFDALTPTLFEKLIARGAAAA